jgi:uncharacterized protein YbcI
MTETRYKRLERSLEEQICTFYAAQLERQPRQVSCQISTNKLAIFLEDALTYPEQLLLTAGQVKLVQQIREGLNAILQPHLQTLIEQAMEVDVVELLMATQFDTGMLTINAILAKPLE